MLPSSYGLYTYNTWWAYTIVASLACNNNCTMKFNHLMDFEQLQSVLIWKALCWQISNVQLPIQAQSSIRKCQCWCTWIYWKLSCTAGVRSGFESIKRKVTRSLPTNYISTTPLQLRFKSVNSVTCQCAWLEGKLSHDNLWLAAGRYRILMPWSLRQWLASSSG